MSDRFRPRSLTRRAGKAGPKNRVIIVCYDGERTEAEYFTGWRRLLGAAGITLRPYFVASGGNALAAVKAAATIKQRDTDHDEFWCICDTDDTSAAELNSAIVLAAKKSIELCRSTRCFEVWIALHWEKISTAPISCEKDAVRLVSKHFSAYKRGEKTVPFSALLPLTQDAISNAEWLESQSCLNPSTSVHKLVCKLWQAYLARL